MVRISPPLSYWATKEYNEEQWERNKQELIRARKELLKKDK